MSITILDSMAARILVRQLIVVMSNLVDLMYIWLEENTFNMLAANAPMPIP